jgi:hypothetical protein
MSQNKSVSSIPNNAGDTAATKTDSTASTKVTAKKKHQQQKNHKANPPAKRKQQQAVKSVFEGNASGVSPMKGIVIAQGNGNLTDQLRVFQEKLAGAAADDQAYGLVSAILDLVPKVKKDFVNSFQAIKGFCRYFLLVKNAR